MPLALRGMHDLSAVPLSISCFPASGDIDTDGDGYTVDVPPENDILLFLWTRSRHSTSLYIMTTAISFKVLEDY